VARIEDAHGDGCAAAEFAGDGHLLLTGGRDKCAALWDVAAVFADRARHPP